MTIPGAFEESQYAAVADGRYLIRRAFRIIDQEARRMGTDPLAFQALVQLAGVRSATRTVTDLSVRLDIPRGLASRLAGIALFGDMVMAMITVTWATGLNSQSSPPGYQLNLALGQR